MKTIIVLLCITCSAYSQQLRLLSFRTDSSVVLRWIGNTNPAIDAWNVQRSIDDGMFTPISSTPLRREFSYARAAERVGSYKAGYYLMLFGVDAQRDITQQDVQKTLTSENVGFHFALLAAQPDLSDLTGERFEDVSIPQGATTVRYRIVGNATGIEAVRKETETITLTHVNTVPVPDSIAVDGLDNSVRLRWPRDKKQADQGDVVGFRVWKANSEFGPFEEVTSMISTTMFGNEDDEKWYSWTDEFIDNGNSAFYYVRQIHGTGAMGNRSEIVRATSGSNTPPLPPSTFTATVFGVAVQLSWTLSDESVAPSRIQLLRRISDGKSKWVSRDIDVSDTSYLDALVDVGVPYQYALEISHSNQKTSSDTIDAFIADAVAPEPPTGLSSVSDTGRITLKWRRSTSKDVAGYHVYRSSDGKNQTRLQLTNALITDSMYVDVMSREAQGLHGYFVTAEDRSGNSSQPSETVRARTTDVTPPVAPQIVRFVQEGSVVTIGWTSSRSPDVARYIVEQSDSTMKWRSVDTTLETTTTVTVSGAGRFLFRVFAEDSSKNSSKPSAVRSITIEQKLEAPQRLSVVRQDVDLKIQWAPVAGAAGYRVVRIDPRTGLSTTCATLSATETTWLDKFSQRDKPWSYQVSARNASWLYGPAAEHSYQPPKE